MTLILPEERLDAIRLRLGRGQRLLAAELAREFATSEDTIRRDLRHLAAAGLCKRVYGGALPLSPASGSLAQRATEHPARKAALARAAVSLVRPGQILFIDVGSTNQAIARALPQGQGLTVVTNAPDIASVLIHKPGIALLLIGGQVNHRLGAAFGARALRQIGEIRADLCIIGACAVDAEAGFNTFDPEDAVMKRAMLEASSETISAVTTEKLGTAAPFLFARIGEVGGLVVEADAGPSIDTFRVRGLAVTVADPVSGEPR